MSARAREDTKVIGVLPEGRRLVELSDQWVIEEEHPSGWKPRWYFHTKEGLRFYGVPKELLEGLPDRFPAH